MITTRRQFLTTAAAAGSVTVLPFVARGAAHEMNQFASGSSTVTVHPVQHASVVLETPAGVIYVDPVGEAALYDGLPPAQQILITHEHGDHFKVETLQALVKDGTQIVANPAVYGMLPEDLKARASEIANGGSTQVLGARLDAIPAYNTTADRLNFHPKGRDNGYVLTLGDMRVYLSGDTEDIPEMRALKDIDLAFVCMNLPFTMDVNQAASAIAEFRPTYVYPYHYRGRDDGTQDPKVLAQLVGDAAEVQLHNWYGDF